MGVSIIGGLSQANAARKAAREAQEERDMYEGQIRGLEASRQQIIDPYANVKDLSSMITNPFANLQVATKAAEMQAEEQDISLATTLETLRATGASAGGATALAQAASRSKAQIAASIEQQEAQKMFYNFTKQYDKRRDVDFVKVFPEYEQFLEIFKYV